jgi:hypothetical protein
MAWRSKEIAGVSGEESSAKRRIKSEAKAALKSEMAAKTQRNGNKQRRSWRRKWQAKTRSENEEKGVKKKRKCVRKMKASKNIENERKYHHGSNNNIERSENRNEMKCWRLSAGGAKISKCEMANMKENGEKWRRKLARVKCRNRRNSNWKENMAKNEMKKIKRK